MTSNTKKISLSLLQNKTSRISSFFTKLPLKLKQCGILGATQNTELFPQLLTWITYPTNYLPPASGEHPNTPRVSLPPPSPDVDFTATMLLRDLHVTISNLPSTVPLANESDSTASFSSGRRWTFPKRGTWIDVLFYISIYRK